MEMKRKAYNIIFAAILLLIFLFMFWCNMNTPMLADDYKYCFDFSLSAGPYTRIENVGQIFDSMQGHRNTMNGRILPHFLVQLFLLLPGIVFDLVNAAVFTALVFVSYKSSFLPEGRDLSRSVFSIFILCGMFSCFWLFQPSFGQVNIWLDGSVNYLWAGLVSMLFVYIYVTAYMKDKLPENTAEIGLSCLVAFAVGSWSENAGGACLVLGIMTIAALKIIKKRRVMGLLPSLIALAAGLAITVAAPAELVNKVSSDGSIMDMFWKLPTVLSIFKSFWPLWIAAAVLLTTAIVKGAKQDTVVMSVIFITAALAASVCLVLGKYIVERNFFFTVILLTVCCALLMGELLEKEKNLIFIALVILFMSMPYPILTGMIDIGNTNRQAQENEAYIYECINSGESQVFLPNIVPETKYSAFYGARYVNNDSPREWPNDSMAEYYGIDDVIGAW